MRKLNVVALALSLISICCSLFCIMSLLGMKSDSRENLTTQYVMYVGTNDKDTYKPEHSAEEAREIVDQVCLKYFEGYTLQDATGAWMDENNKVTHEYTLVCYFDGADQDTVHKAADELIEKLNQNTILIERDDFSAEYYSGKN